jgi:hypothetical protein
MLGHLFIPHETRNSETGENHTYPKKHENMTLSTTWSISIGNNVGKAGTENTFIYTITQKGGKGNFHMAVALETSWLN